jgi:alpha-aminoadipic semialdehyde synthase
LAPADVAKLVQAGVRVVVQPSERRIYKDSEYASVGAEISDNISDAHTIFGVKEFPKESLIPNKTYVMFAHVIKGQEENMPFLDECMKRNVRLIDYECIKATPQDGGQRLVAFGEFAGNVGMIDFLRGLGERALGMGFSTPFMNVASSYMYQSLEDAKAGITAVGNEINRVGLPAQMTPLVFAFTGSGNVARGAHEIFDLLPHRTVSSDELPHLYKDRSALDRGELIRVDVQLSDMVWPVGYDGPDTPDFDKQHYYGNPSMYRPVFTDRIAPYTSAIINCMYWDSRYPRLMSNEDLLALRSRHQHPLGFLGASDITCDIQGSLEFLTHSTQIDNPFFVYDPETGHTSPNLEAPGVLMQAVDNLPSELPREATNHFSSKLLPFVESLSLPDEPLGPEMSGAVVCADQKLTPTFEYIDDMRRSVTRAQAAVDGQDTTDKVLSHSTTLLIDGHIFDSGLINNTLDLLEVSDCQFRILEWVLGSDRGSESKVVLQILTSSATASNRIRQQIRDLIKVSVHANAHMHVLPHAPVKKTAKVEEQVSGAPAAQSGSVPQIIGTAERRVLVLGSGFVADPLVDYLSRDGKTEVVVGSNILKQAEDLAHGKPHASAIQLNASDTESLRREIKSSDAVVSLLPASMHAGVAELCLDNNKHMVTASYVSPQMRSLDEAAKSRGLTFMNEVGLDPGIDHMSAMQIIDEIQEEGDRVTSFESVCGGLPAPEAADNPLGYKFSWSPKGVLVAAMNGARYLRKGQIHEVARGDLLKHATPLHLNPAFALEQLPNRISTEYQDIYKLKDAVTMYRGTLRYAGFSVLMNSFFELGLNNDSPQSFEELGLRPGAATWPQLITRLVTGTKQPALAGDELRALVTQRLNAHDGASDDATSQAISAMNWLGMFDPSVTIAKANTILDCFCTLLQQRMEYAPDERDMVLMHHTFGVERANGDKEQLTSTLLAYGDQHWSAMARTVGIPAAITTKLIIDGAFERRGVLIPTTPDIYKPCLEMCAAEGIQFKEASIPLN